MKVEEFSEPAPPRKTPVTGHVHLRVADLDRAAGFYRDVMGFRLAGCGPDLRLPVAFLAGGENNHHTGLNTSHQAWAGQTGPVC